MDTTQRIHKTGVDRKARLEALRAKRIRAEQANKRDLAQDLKNQRLKSLNHKNLEKSLLKAEEQLDKITSVEEGTETEFERKQALAYTIRDVIEWHTNKKAPKPNAGGYNNFVDLAALSYKRDVSTLDVDLSAYKNQKESEAQRLTGDAAHSVRILQPNTDKAAIDSAVDNLQKGNERRRLQTRKRPEDDGSTHHINEKNRQFNLKLNRQYDKQLGD